MLLQAFEIQFFIVVISIIITAPPKKKEKEKKLTMTEHLSIRIWQ